MVRSELIVATALRTSLVSFAVTSHRLRISLVVLVALTRHLRPTHIIILVTTTSLLATTSVVVASAAATGLHATSLVQRGVLLLTIIRRIRVHWLNVSSLEVLVDLLG